MAKVLLVGSADSGSRLDAPTRRGFGTELVERRVPYELHGRGRVEVTAKGALVSVEFPLGPGASILETGAPVRKSVFGGSIDMSGEPSLEGSHILILEDDYLLASDVESALLDVGAEVLGPFSLQAEAVEVVRQGDLSAAVIDINLGMVRLLRLLMLCEKRKCRSSSLLATTMPQSLVSWQMFLGLSNRWTYVNSSEN